MKIFFKIRQKLKDNSFFRLWYSRLKSVWGSIILPNYSKKLKIIWITGTDGKTSSSYFLAQCLELNGFNVWLICSEFLRDGKNKNANFTKRTTPSPIFIRKFLKSCALNWVDFVILEVSAHAISQWRIFGILFDFVAITNITPEHLDYYQNIREYAKTKLKILQKIKKNNIQEFDFNKNYSNNNSWQISDLVFEKSNIYSQSIKDIADWWQQNYPIVSRYWKFFLKKWECYKISNDSIFKKYIINTFDFKIKKQDINNIIFDLEIWDQKIENCQINLFGSYNIKNTIISAIILNEIWINDDKIKQTLSKIKPTPWRMNLIRNLIKKDPQNPVLIFLDYAVTPDAFLNILSNSKKIIENKQNGKLWVVFGCTWWNHDHTKRLPMGKISSEIADFVVLTEDEHYGEDVEDIILQIMQGVDQKNKSKIHIEYDRKNAIIFALEQSKDGDIVIITWMAGLNSRNTKQWEINWSDSDIVNLF